MYQATISDNESVYLYYITRERLVPGRVVYLNILRQHRKRLAEEAGLRPYLIFPDTVLIDLANFRPTTLGVGWKCKRCRGAKLKKIRPQLFEAIAEYKG